MVRKKLKAILALLVAVMFVLQAAPMYSFAEESAKDAGTVTAEQFWAARLLSVTRLVQRAER